MIGKSFGGYLFKIVIFVFLVSSLVACKKSDLVPEPKAQSLISTEAPSATATLLPLKISPTEVATIEKESVVHTPTLTKELPVATTLKATTIGGWIVFESRREDTNEDGIIDFEDGVHIYSLNLDTNVFAQLTTGHHKDLRPTWSPDKKYIVFTSNRKGNFDLYTMKADGSTVRQLTSTLVGETTPVWSPNGDQIAYVSVETLESGLQRKTIHLLNVEDAVIDQSFASNGNDSNPTWSLDGRYLAFDRAEEHINVDGSISIEKVIYLIDAKTNQEFRITETSRESGKGAFDHPLWLPKADGYFLSMVQTPGDKSSTGVKVFEIIWEDSEPKLFQVLAIDDVGGNVTWGPNSEWLIAVVNNDQISEELPRGSKNELSYIPIQWEKPNYQLGLDPARQNSNHISLIDRVLITNNLFFDDNPK
jgi:hypothetical protein